MPTNVTREYLNAELTYHKAKTPQEKMDAIREMLATVPKHKGTEVLRMQLRARLKRIQQELAIQKKKRAGRFSIAIKKEGFQIVIIGFPNTGKSTLLSKLTNATPKIAEYPFTTKKPEVGVMDYEGGKIQLVEIPALVKGAAEKQRELLSQLGTADGIILMADDNYQRVALSNELKTFGVDKPLMVAGKDAMPTKKQIFEHFGLIRVYTKEKEGKPKMDEPIIMRKGATILEAAKEVHKDFAEKLRYARVWGSAKFPGQRVEKDFMLRDRDIVEFSI